MKRAFLTALAGVALAAGPASGQTKVTLRVADSFPVSHLISIDGAKLWMDRAKALSGGRIDFEYFPAQQLGKAADLLRLTQSGVADVAYVAPSYVSERMPLSEVFTLPGMVESGCAATAIYWKLATAGSLAKNDFEQNRVKPLLAVVLPPYQFFGPRQAINSLADIKGMKVRSGGGTADLVIHALGGVPVKLTAPETREALERGTIDLHLGNNGSQKPYGHLPFIRFGTTDAPLTSFVVTYVIGQRKWDSLPQDIRASLARAGEEASTHLCEALEREDKSAVVEMEQAGAKLYRLAATDRAIFEKMSDQIAREWAAGLDGRNKPGSAVLKELKAVMGRN